MTEFDASKFEKEIDYVFQNKHLLRQALTHSSYINEHRLAYHECNERLEFFGDAILEAYSSAYLFITFPKEHEGDLSKRRTLLVCEKTLSEAARAIHLGDYLLMGVGAEKNHGRDSDAILSDAFEALLGAVAFDGHPEKAKALINTYVLSQINAEPFFDAKTVLQEFVQYHHYTIAYEEIAEEGPDHDKRFNYGVLINGERKGEGWGKSKKEAQNEAAKAALLKYEGGH